MTKSSTAPQVFATSDRAGLARRMGGRGAAGYVVRPPNTCPQGRRDSVAHAPDTKSPRTSRTTTRQDLVRAARNPLDDSAGRRWSSAANGVVEPDGDELLGARTLRRRWRARLPRTRVRGLEGFPCLPARPENAIVVEARYPVTGGAARIARRIFTRTFTFVMGGAAAIAAATSPARPVAAPRLSQVGPAARWA